MLSAIAGVWLSGGDNNIFTQIGLIVLVGLACKNAILIVEFARKREQEGASTWDAVVEACRLRLRPILMTSIAFIAGVVPLVLSTGAGSEMRNAMGVAVFSGNARRHDLRPAADPRLLLGRAPPHRGRGSDFRRVLTRIEHPRGNRCLTPICIDKE